MVLLIDVKWTAMKSTIDWGLSEEINIDIDPGTLLLRFFDYTKAKSLID